MNNYVNNVTNFNNVNSKETIEKKRFIEIDVAKGIAVCLMMFFHYFYLGEHMNILDVDTSTGILHLCAKLAHTTFIIASGANLVISTSGKTFKEYIPKKIKRGLYLVAVGLIISYLTKIEFGESYVKFGIMHFMGTATILSSFLLKWPTLIMILSSGILLLDYMLKYVKGIKERFYGVCEKNSFACFIAGIMNLKYDTLDHFSLIPYLGYFLLGGAIAFTCYKIHTVKEEMANLEDVQINKWENKWENKNNLDEGERKGITRRFAFLEIFDKFKDNIVIETLGWIGKRSLMFYIIHFIILYCLFKIMQITKADRIANLLS